MKILLQLKFGFILVLNFQERVADLDRNSRRYLDPRDFMGIYIGPIGRVAVLEFKDIIFPFNNAVNAGSPIILDGDIRLGRSANGHATGSELMTFAAVLADKNHQMGMQVAVFYKGPGILEDGLVEIGCVVFFHK